MKQRNARPAEDSAVCGIGYKIVYRKGNKLYSIMPPHPPHPSKGWHEPRGGLYLGSTPEFCLDFYSATDEGEFDIPGFDGEVLLAMQYNVEDVMSDISDCTHPYSEIIVRKAKIINMQRLENKTQNPLDPHAYSKGFAGGGWRPVASTALNIGVHVTDNIDIATLYAVNRAAGQGVLDEDEPNCGIVLAIDVSNFEVVPEGDGIKLCRDIGADLATEMLNDTEVKDALESHDESEIIHAVQKWADWYLSNADVEEDAEQFESWWFVSWKSVGGMDVGNLVSWISDLDDESLLTAVKRIQKTKTFSEEDCAEAIHQWRIMDTINSDRIIEIHAVHPVDLHVPAEDEWNENPSEQLEFGFEPTDYAPYVPSEDDPIPSLVTLYSAKPHSKNSAVLYHGTDVRRARLAFPNLAWNIYCPWRFGQPTL